MLRFYTKPWCPLCDEAREVLEQAGLEWEEVNILDFPEFKKTYGSEIPVVQWGRNFWFCRDRQKVSLDEWLKKFKGESGH